MYFFQAPWDPRSETIEAILQLQVKTSETSEKGITTTRLLVPSSKVGCLLGQGGQVINEMRRRTCTDISFLTKKDKPKWVASDEDLVQISGNFKVAKDALADIASRLRARVFRDANGGAELSPVRQDRRCSPLARSHVNRPYPSGTVVASDSRAYEMGGRGYERRCYPVHSSDAGYTNINSRMRGRMANHAVGFGVEGINRNENFELRWKLQDHQYGASDHEADFRGSSGHFSAPQSSLYDYTDLSTQFEKPLQGHYQSYHYTSQNTYPNTTTH